MTNRHAEFAAKHKRQPTPDEAREIEAQEREDVRAKENTRRETELRRAYVAAGGSKEEFERVKGDLIAKDRAEQAVKNKDAARRAQARLYQGF
jgi:hypothetical protein